MMAAVTAAQTTAPAPDPSLRAWLRDLGAVVAQGGRLWVRSWPLLLVIALLAVAARHAAGWAAVNASTVNSTLGWAVLVLAPLSMVAGIVAMLHVLRRDLPALAAIGRTRGPDDATSGHERGLVDVLASVFVPFLALYASYGLLKEDRDRFLNTAAYRQFAEQVDFTGQGDGPDGSFVDLATGWGLVALVVAAVVLRWLLGRWEGRTHRRTLAFVGAYVEAFWLLAVAAFATQLLDRAWEWVESRRAVSIVLDWWLTVLDALGPVAAPVDAVVTRWRACSATSTTSSSSRSRGSPSARSSTGTSWRRPRGASRACALRPPGNGCPRLCAAGPPKPPLRSSATCVDASRLWSTGCAGSRSPASGPMLVFALAFLAATRIEEGHPDARTSDHRSQDVDTWLAFAPMVSSVATAVGLTVTMALLAAGVDRILGGQAAAQAQEPASVPTEV